MSQMNSRPFCSALSANGLRTPAWWPPTEDDGLELELARFDLGESNVVEDGQQRVGDERTVARLSLFGAEIRIEHQLGHADDAVHRRPDS